MFGDDLTAFSAKGRVVALTSLPLHLHIKHSALSVAGS